ncbi:Glycosyltransferase (fragment) [metagenome]
MRSLLDDIDELLKMDVGYPRRLEKIKKTIHQKSPIWDADLRYVEQLAKHYLIETYNYPKNNSVLDNNTPKTIFKKQEFSSEEEKSEVNLKDNQKKQNKKDPALYFLTAAIFIFLISTVFWILGPISSIAMGLGGAITIYHLIQSRTKPYSKNISGRRMHQYFCYFC